MHEHDSIIRHRTCVETNRELIVSFWCRNLGPDTGLPYVGHCLLCICFERVGLSTSDYRLTWPIGFKELCEACRKANFEFTSKTDFMAPSYDEMRAFKQIRIPDFERRQVWATDRTGVERTHIGLNNCAYKCLLSFIMVLRSCISTPDSQHIMSDCHVFCVHVELSHRSYSTL